MSLDEDGSRIIPSRLSRRRKSVRVGWGMCDARMIMTAVRRHTRRTRFGARSHQVTRAVLPFETAACRMELCFLRTILSAHSSAPLQPHGVCLCEMCMLPHILRGLITVLFTSTGTPTTALSLFASSSLLRRPGSTARLDHETSSRQVSTRSGIDMIIDQDMSA
jgi:hypothetical protein